MGCLVQEKWVALAVMCVLPKLYNKALEFRIYTETHLKL